MVKLLAVSPAIENSVQAIVSKWESLAGIPYSTAA